MSNRRTLSAKIFEDPLMSHFSKIAKSATPWQTVKVRWVLLFCTMGLFLFAHKPVLAQPVGKKVALVIGNSAYERAPLRNPVNDAQDLAQKLRQLGFVVTQLSDRNRSQMTQAIRDFGQVAKGAEAALFYFAGHGVQVRGKNYLIPIGQAFLDEAEIESDAVEVNNVLARIEEASPSVSLLILDACRTVPIRRSGRDAPVGLARMLAPSGALIAFATQAGAEALDGTGRNGTFTKHLLTHIGTPGLPVEQMFKRVRSAVELETQRAQSPREESSLTAEFYFARSANSVAVPELPAASKDALTAFVEKLKGKSVVSIGLVGHADQTTGANANELSTARAAAVKTFLVNLGIAPNLIFVSGIGSSKPVRDSSTAEGRALNNRVELDVVILQKNSAGQWEQTTLALDAFM